MASRRRRRQDGEPEGLAKACRDVIYDHVYANADREVGGVIVGRIPRRGGPPLVTGAIQAIAADEQRATLTFTQDTWEHVHRVLDEQFRDDVIVGWYHSHPSFGVFLSEHDLFIHHNFFGGPSQVALVVDPQFHREGLFVWADGEVVPLYEREVPGLVDLPKSAKSSSTPVGNAVPVREPARRSRRYPPLLLLIGLMCGVLLGLGGWQLATGGTSPAVLPSAVPATAADATGTTSRAATTESSCLMVTKTGANGGFEIPCDDAPASASTTAKDTP